MDNNTNARVLKILTQVIISGFSLVGSPALSDSFGLSNHDNGFLAVAMGSMINLLSLLLACWKFICSWGEKVEPVIFGAIMGVSITDATLIYFKVWLQYGMTNIQVYLGFC